MLQDDNIMFTAIASLLSGSSRPENCETNEEESDLDCSESLEQCKRLASEDCNKEGNKEEEQGNLLMEHLHQDQTASQSPIMFPRRTPGEHGLISHRGIRATGFPDQNGERSCRHALRR